MGPEVRSKSAGRCFNQGSRCCRAVVKDQPSLRVSWASQILPSQFLEFLDRGCFMRYRHSQALRTHLTFIPVRLLMSVILAFVAGISFISFKPLFSIITKVLEQIVTIIVTILAVHCYVSSARNRGDTHTVPACHLRTLCSLTPSWENTENSRKHAPPSSLTPLLTPK
jgi:hypothetical protein